MVNNIENMIEIKECSRANILNFIQVYHKESENKLEFVKTKEEQPDNPNAVDFQSILRDFRVVAKSISSPLYLVNTITKHIYGIYDIKKRTFFYRKA